MIIAEYKTTSSLKDNISRIISPNEQGSITITTRSDTVKVLVGAYSKNSLGFFYDLKNIKFEKGNKVTDWTSSAKDIDLNIADAKQAGVNAQDAINSMNDDSIFDRVEKQTIRTKWEAIQGINSLGVANASGSYMKTVALAGSVVSTNALGDKYAALKGFLSDWGLYVDENSVSGFLRTTMSALFKEYYNEEIDVLDKVSKGYVDNVEIGGENYFSNSILELGSISSATGANAVAANRMRSVGFIPFVGQYITIAPHSVGYNYAVSFYDSNNNYLTSTIITSGGWLSDCKTFDVPIGTAYIRYVVRRSNDANITSADYSVKYMIERGNKASDWTPSLADQKAAISEAASAIVANRKEFSPTTIYYNSNSRTDIARRNNQYYKYKGVDGIAGAWVASNWEPISSYESIATDLFLAEEANIAGFSYKNQRMVSQAETGGKPNLMLDGIAGDIQAQKGSIGIMDVTPNDQIINGDGGNKIWFRKESFSTIAEAISLGATGAPANQSLTGVQAHANLDTLVEDSSTTPAFNASQGVSMTFNYSGSVTLQTDGGGGSMGVIPIAYAQLLLLDSSNNIVAVLFNGGLDSFSGTINYTITATGTYRIRAYVSARVMYADSSTPTGTYARAQFSAINPIVFTASARKNLKTPKGDAVVAASNKYFAFNGDLWEAMLGNGGIRLNPTTGAPEKTTNGGQTWTAL